MRGECGKSTSTNGYSLKLRGHLLNANHSAHSATLHEMFKVKRNWQYLWLQLSRGVTRSHEQYYFCQFSKFDRLQIVNGAPALAQLASDLGSGRQATGRLTAIPIAYSWLCHRSSCIFKETVSTVADSLSETAWLSFSCTKRIQAYSVQLQFNCISSFRGTLHSRAFGTSVLS